MMHMKYLEQLEEDAYGGDPDAAFNQLMVLLTVLSAKINDKMFHLSGSNRKVTAYYTRLAAATLYLIKNQKLNLNKLRFLKLCGKSSVIHNVFEASGYAGSEILLKVLSKTDETGSKVLASQDLLRIWPLMSLDDIPVPIFEMALKQSDDILIPLILAWLQHETILTATGESNRGQLIDTLFRKSPSSFLLEPSSAMARAWMYCSYADSPSKHELKRSLNKMIVNWINSNGVNVPCAQRRNVKRPTILVVGERLRSTHAMYRCYGPSIKALGAKFRLVLIAQTNEFDETSRAMFEEVIELNAENIAIGTILKNIQALSPDIIYYPSVGMSLWAIMMANLRLAPIQIMSSGHPATSMSDQMDYFMLPRGVKPYEGVYSEIVVWLKGNMRHDPHPLLPKKLIPKTVVGNDIINIAINSKSLKISYRLLDICERIESLSRKNVCFHFFPGEDGLRYSSLHSRLLERFPKAVVYPTSTYDIFLSRLAICDLSLAAFPFGNTNSTVDACILGIPVVAHWGQESHSQSDARVITTVGLPKWLIAEDDEEYLRVALRLIDNDDERLGLSKYLLESATRERLFGLDQHTGSRHFTDAFLWIYENDEKIRNSGKRIVSLDDSI